MVEVRLCKENEIQYLVKLSKDFENENCCNNIKSDDYNYFKSIKVYVAVIDNEIIGYAYGKEDCENNERSYSKKGDKYFELEEIYVSKLFRSQGVGKMLYWYIEAMAKFNGCKTIRLNAVSKDYKRLLKFYIEELKMDFISAYLVKQI